MYMEIMATITAVAVTLNLLNNLLKPLFRNKIAGQLQLSAEQQHHQAKLRTLLSLIMHGKELSQSESFVPLLKEYTEAIVRLGAIQRIRRRVDKALCRRFSRNHVSFPDYQIRILNGIFADPDIEAIVPPDYPSDEVPMHVQVEYNVRKSRSIERSDTIVRGWTDVFNGGPFHIDAAKRAAAWKTFTDQKRLYADAELQLYENALTRLGASRVSLDWNSNLRVRMYRDPNLKGPDHTSLIPQSAFEYRRLDNLKGAGETGALVEQVACFAGEVKLSQETARATVEAISKRLVAEEGIAEELLTEFSERVLILYGSLSVDDILNRKSRISEALRDGKMPQPQDVSSGLGFHTPFQFTVLTVMTEVASIVSTTYSQWLGKTVASLKKSVESMNLNDSDSLLYSLNEDNLN